MLFKTLSKITIFSLLIATCIHLGCSSKKISNSPKNTLVKPFFVDENPTPNGKNWSLVENLSDEFNGKSFNDKKWHRNAETDGFGWQGRFPGLFESENVSVDSGFLNVTVKKFESPKKFKGKDWTHGGAIIRSKETAKHGRYYECKMKANKTVMSSTFWIAFKQNCETGPKRKLELDILECVGRVHKDTKKWAKNWDQIFHSNVWRHQRTCDVAKTVNSPSKTILSEKNSSRFFVYGCWWKSPKEILFYLDGKFTHKITNPPTDFDIEGHITLAIETYDWNPIDENNIFETASKEDRTTKYDWVRVWELEDK